MDRSRFSTHKRPALLLAGVLLVLLGILGAWHVLSRQAQWTVLDQAALENAGDAHLRALSQQAEQCAGRPRLSLDRGAGGAHQPPLL